MRLESVIQQVQTSMRTISFSFKGSIVPSGKTENMPVGKLDALWGPHWRQDLKLWVWYQRRKVIADNIKLYLADALVRRLLSSNLTNCVAVVALLESAGFCCCEG